MSDESGTLVEPLVHAARPRNVARGETLLTIVYSFAAVSCAVALSSVPSTFGLAWQRFNIKVPAITLMQPARVEQSVQLARVGPTLGHSSAPWRGYQQQIHNEAALGPYVQAPAPNRQIQVYARGGPFTNLVGKNQLGQSTIIGPSYNFAIGSLAITAALVGANAPIPLPLFFGALSVLTGVQSGRVRFAFDRTALEVLVEDKEGEIKQSGDNFETGTQNRWNYKTFTRWNFVPSESLPLFVYFYETETKGGNEEQFHLFPVIMNSKELAITMKEKIGVDKMK